MQMHSPVGGDQAGAVQRWEDPPDTEKRTVLFLIPLLQQNHAVASCVCSLSPLGTNWG